MARRNLFPSGQNRGGSNETVGHPREGSGGSDGGNPSGNGSGIERADGGEAKAEETPANVPQGEPIEVPIQIPQEEEEPKRRGRPKGSKNKSTSERQDKPGRIREETVYGWVTLASGVIANTRPEPLRQVWPVTDQEADAIVPPLTRIVNRLSETNRKRIEEYSDPLMVIFALAQMAQRRVSDEQRIIAHIRSQQQGYARGQGSGSGNATRNPGNPPDSTIGQSKSTIYAEDAQTGLFTTPQRA